MIPIGAITFFALVRPQNVHLMAQVRIDYLHLERNSDLKRMQSFKRLKVKWRHQNSVDDESARCSTFPFALDFSLVNLRKSEDRFVSIVVAENLNHAVVSAHE